MSRKSRSTELHLVPNDDTEYLLTDLNELVNNAYERLMEGTSLHVAAESFRPNAGFPDLPLPEGVGHLRTLHAINTAKRPKGFRGFDVAFTLDATQPTRDLSVIARWADHSSTSIIETHLGPTLLCQNADGTTAFCQSLEQASADILVQDMGLPADIFAPPPQRNVRNIINSLCLAESVKTKRTSQDVLDYATTIDVTHSSHIANDLLGERKIVQELTLDTTHYNERDIGLGTSLSPDYRHTLRFTRGGDEKIWQFAGHYDGRLTSGDEPHILAVESHRLAVPPSNLLAKTLAYLETVTAK